MSNLMQLLQHFVPYDILTLAKIGALSLIKMRATVAKGVLTLAPWLN
jgi:hypothetical protein